MRRTTSHTNDVESTNWNTYYGAWGYPIYTHKNKGLKKHSLYVSAGYGTPAFMVNSNNEVNEPKEEESLNVISENEVIEPTITETTVKSVKVKKPAKETVVETSIKKEIVETTIESKEEKIEEKKEKKSSSGKKQVKKPQIKRRNN